MTNREIVLKCLSDPVCDLSKYDRVLTVTLISGGKPIEMPVWRFMESCEWVIDQDTNQLVHFRLRWPQRVLYSVLCEQKMNGLPMRVDILKARQLGLSTFISGLYLPLTIFTPNTRTCVMADLEDHSKNLFGIYQNFYDHLIDSFPNADEIQEDSMKGKRNPGDIRPTLSHMREGQMMRTEAGNSTIECVTAGVSAGRSAHYRYVHDSETAFQKNLEQTCTSLFSTVSVNDADSIIIVETTANGYNDYKARWDRDMSGATSFAALFFPWFRHPGYTRKAPLGKTDYPLWFYDKLHEHPEVNGDQLFWYFVKYGDYTSEKMMKQEYPWDPEDAFISTGTSVFDMALLKKRMDEAEKIPYRSIVFGYDREFSEDGQTIRVSDVREEEIVSEKAWRVYEEPAEGRHYTVICDPTKGDNNDYSAIVVQDQNTGTQMAVYNAKERLDEVAFQIYCAAVHYNNALVSSENNTGPAILDMLVRMGYEKIYVTQSAVYDNYNQTYTSKLGHSTTRGNRDGFIQDFAIAFRDNPKMIRDYQTLAQMSTFQYMKSANSDTMKAQASSTKYHDDIVMAMAPFWKIRIQQDFDRRRPDENKPMPKLTNQQLDERWEGRLADRKRREGEKNRVHNVTGITW